MDVRALSNIVVIDEEPFAIMRDGENTLWRDVAAPIEQGDPKQPKIAAISDWSRGQGDSHGAVPGAVERAINAYLGHAGRILPGPAVTTVATPLNGDIRGIVDVGAGSSRRLVIGGGRYAIELDSALLVTATQDFGAGKSVTSMQAIKGELAVALGDGVRFWRRDAAGVWSECTTGSDSAGDYRYADCFGITADGHLARGRGPYWSKSLNDNWSTGAGSWSAENQIGDSARRILGVFDFQRWDYVLKEDGLYAFDDSTIDMVNELPDMRGYPVTEASSFAWYNRLFLCTPAGLYRYVQLGGARTVGLEDNRLNLTFDRDAYPTAGTAYGTWAYIAYYSPSSNTTRIHMVRLATDGDATMSPFTFVSAVDEFTGRCRAMAISDITGTPVVYYGAGSSLRYFQLSRNGLPVAFRTSGQTIVQQVVPSEARMTKRYLRSIKVEVENAGAGSYLDISWSWDGVSWNAMSPSITTNGISQRFVVPGSNDSGYTLWVRYALTNASASLPIAVKGIEIAMEERPATARAAIATLRLRDYLVEGKVASRLTAYEQLEFLRQRFALGSCTIVDPYGASWRAAITEIQGEGALAMMGKAAQPMVTIFLRELQYG